MTVKWFAKEVSEKILRAANTGIFRGAEAVLEEARRLILSPPKTGKIYRRRSIEHQASAPGEAPASDTGRLVQSGRTEYDRKEVLGRIIFSANYAASLELGTLNMQPRPFARPALAAKRDFIQQAVAEEIAIALKS